MTPNETPFYIRWNPDRSSYAIELKLELVSNMGDELAESEKLGVEIGGVLIGSFPSARTPTLRIEDFEIIPRRPEDGEIYMLDPSQHERFAEVRSSIKTSGRAAIGFFRSHVRTGPLKPSLTDRSLLSGQFSQATYAVLLVQAQEPRTAAFFVAANGQPPDEPSVKEFRFDESAFRALPEIEPEAIEEQPRPRARAAIWRYAWIPILLVAGLIAMRFLWPQSNENPSSPMGLAITATDRVLNVSWNHGSREIASAADGALLIVDGVSRREIKLGPDELKLGTVGYEKDSEHVGITMTLNKPGSTLSSESVDWSNK